MFEKQTGEPELEVKVTVLNINEGKNAKLLSKCGALRGYMAFVRKVRENKTEPWLMWKKEAAGKAKKLFRKYRFYIVAFMIAFAAPKAIFSTILCQSHILSGSMEPLIQEGDILISRRSAGRIGRYNVISFHFEEDGVKTIYIKRVIGLPGETVAVKEGAVYVDGEALEMPYIPDWGDTDGDGVFKVPEGHYFVLGDNRDDSYDSRYWDDPFVGKDDIISIDPYLRIWPISQAGFVDLEPAAPTDGTANRTVDNSAIPQMGTST